MTGEPKEKEEAVSHPPQAQFFDPLKGVAHVKGKLKDLLEKRWVRFLVVLAFILLLIAIFMWPSSGKKAKEVQSPVDEKRIEATPVMMERAIHASAKARKETLPPRGEFQTRGKQRKLNSTIAVFVEKKDSEKETRGASQRGGREETPPLGIPAGTKIPALLTNHLFSFNVEAPVTCVLPKDFLWNDTVVVPKGSQFLGEADVMKSIDRVNIRFERLILPDGREVRVRGMALSEDGSAGLRGKVAKHTDRKILKALAETAIGTASLLGGGRRGDPYSLEDEARSNLFSNLTSEAQRDIRSTRIEKSIDVPAYTALQVILLEAV